MDDRNLAAKLGQVHGLFHRAVAAAYHIDVQILEERPVASRAIGYALAGEFLLARAADGPGVGAGGNDDGLGIIVALLALQVLDFAFQLHLFDGIIDLFCAKMLRLFRHTAYQAGAGLTLDAAGIVFNLRGDDDLSAVLLLLDDQGGQPGAACIASGGEPRRARADNNYIIDLLIHGFLLVLSFPKGY